MFTLDSLFAAIAPSPPVVVFITYELLLTITVPPGADVHVFTVNGNS